MMIRVLGGFLPCFILSSLWASSFPYLDPTAVELKPVLDDSKTPEAYWAIIPFQWKGVPPLRFSIKSESVQLIDRNGGVWTSLEDGERTIIPKEGEKNYLFKIKMASPSSFGSRENPNQFAVGGFVEARGEFDLLNGINQVEPILLSVLAPRMGKGEYIARQEFDQLRLTLTRIERKERSTTLTVHIEYENGFDFFDSHEERVFRAKSVLRKILPSGAISRLEPTRIRPVRQGVNDALFEYQFPITRFQSFDPDWDLFLPLPSRLEHLSSQTAP